MTLRFITSDRPQIYNGSFSLAGNIFVDPASVESIATLEELNARRHLKFKGSLLIAVFPAGFGYFHPGRTVTQFSDLNNSASH